MRSYEAVFERYGFKSVMSRKGKQRDHTVIESFFVARKGEGWHLATPDGVKALIAKEHHGIRYCQQERLVLGVQ